MDTGQRRIVDVEAITRSGDSARRRMARMGFAAAFSASLLVALAATGSFSYAAGGPKRVAGEAQRALNARGVQIVRNSPAKDQYQKCNSGRGNLSEVGGQSRSKNSSTLVNPHEGGRGPGPYPTGDCDPGNSGAHNRGGD